MTLRKPDLVLFDLDGTLIDTAPDLAWSIDMTLEKLDLPPCGEEKVRAWIGSGIEGLLHRALTNDFNGRADATLFDRALTLFKEIYFDNICERSRVFPGVNEALDYLQSNNIHCACVTNKAERFTEKLLKQIGLYNEFGIIVGGDTLAVKKPRPEPLWHAADHFAVNSSSTLMVGDSVTDINAARAAGMQVLCVPYGYNMNRDIHELKPDAVVDNLADLASLIA